MLLILRPDKQCITSTFPHPTRNPENLELILLKEERGQGLGVNPSGREEGWGDSSHREAKGSGGSEARCVELLREKAPPGRVDGSVVPLWASPQRLATGFPGAKGSE